MNATDTSDATDTVTSATPDLVVTLQRCIAALSQRLNSEDTPLAQMSRLRRACTVIVTFMQTAMGQPIGAIGDDFVGAAQWLAGYYEAAATDFAAQATSTLTIVGADATTQSRPSPEVVANVTTALHDTAAMWRDIATSASSRIRDDADPAPQPSVAGIMRIWTATASALASTATSGQVRDRQELGAMTAIMVQTCREAAVMAAMLGE